MYEKKMKDFRNNIIKSAINKLNKNELEINSKNKNYLSILDSFVSTGSSTNENKNENIKKVNYYLDELKNQNTFFGGSLKFNNKKNIKKQEDKDNLLSNVLICLDEDYKNSLFCEKINEFDNLIYYRKQLVFIYDFINILKNNSIKDPIFTYLIQEKEKKSDIHNRFSIYKNNIMNSMPRDASNIYIWEEYINKYNYSYIFQNNNLINTSNQFLMDHIINLCNENKFNANIKVLQPLKIFLNSKNVIDNKITLELLNSKDYYNIDNKIDINLKNKEQKICTKEIINSFQLNHDFDKLKKNIQLISVGYIFYKDILNGLEKTTEITTIFDLNDKIISDLNKLKTFDKKDSQFNEFIDNQKNLYKETINFIKKKINKYRLYDENTYLINKINYYNKLLDSLNDYIDNDKFNLDNLHSQIMVFNTKLLLNYNRFKTNFMVHHSLIETIKNMCQLNSNKPLVEFRNLHDNKYDIDNYFTNQETTYSILNNKYSLLPIYIYIQNSQNTSFVNTNHLVMLIDNNRNNQINNINKFNKPNRDDLECTLFLLKGDGKYEIQENDNFKLFETNLYYDYYCLQENKDIKNKDMSFFLINTLLDNFKKNMSFRSLNINIQNSYVSNNRIINFNKLRSFFDDKLQDKSDIKIKDNYLSKINLIKTDFFYLENFYECLFTIFNNTDKKIFANFLNIDNLNPNENLNFQNYIENYLIKKQVLDNFDIDKKINKLKNKDTDELKKNINKYISKYFNENKSYYKKYMDLLKSISIYCNGFINQLKIKDLNNIFSNDFKDQSYLFKSRLYFNTILNDLNNKDNKYLNDVIDKNYKSTV